MDYKVVIDPGHGGEDVGASGNGIIEKDLTLNISKYMYDRFRDLGIPVSITRTDDVTLNPGDRTDKIKGFYGTGNNVIVISNHINAGGGDGAEVIYALRNNDNLARRITNEIANTDQNTREYYQRRLPSDPSQDYYFIHRDTKNNQSVIVEYGFLDSALDDVSQLKNNWQQYAEAVVKAVADYAGANYVPADTVNNYVVEKGDSLWSIAKKFGISVNELKELNNLSSNLLSIGQVLKIRDVGVTEPPIESSDNVYKVAKGDTLYSIARKFNTTVDEIKRLNNLTSNTLSVGQNLIVSVSSSTTTSNTYTVKAGDNLYSIARKYNSTVDELKRINNLSSNTLSIGQKLTIPQSADTNQTYTVKAGDNLYSIARANDTTVDAIKRLNNLSSNLLSIGQKLLIPTN